MGYRKKSFDEISNEYFCGKCMYLACALHKRHGWTIGAFIDRDSAGRWIDHSWAINDAGQAVDINGAQDADSVESIGSGSTIIKDNNLSLADVMKLTGDTIEEFNRKIQEAEDIIDQHLALRENGKDFRPDLSSWIPKKEEFLSEEYINGILSTGLWCDHGDGLHMFIQDECPVHLSNMEEDEALKHPDLRKELVKWLPLRYDYVVNELHMDIPAFPLEIKRSLYVDDATQERIVSGELRQIGVFWGVHFVESWGAIPAEGQHEITVTATVMPEDINWTETLRSRMDYSNGDGECEIQIYPHAEPNMVSLDSEKDHKRYVIRPIDAEYGERSAIKTI